MPFTDGIPGGYNRAECEAFMGRGQCSELKDVLVEQGKIIDETVLEEGLACVDQEPFSDAASCYTLIEKRQGLENKRLMTAIHYVRAKCTCYDEDQSVSTHPSIKCRLIGPDRTESWIDAAVLCLHI